MSEVANTVASEFKKHISSTADLLLDISRTIASEPGLVSVEWEIHDANVVFEIHAPHNTFGVDAVRRLKTISSLTTVVNAFGRKMNQVFTLKIVSDQSMQCAIVS